MEEYLYRYISFEIFVGMIQSKSLTFVLPELWDDPKECASLEYYIEQADNFCEKSLLLSLYYKTFCQCWTKLAESDAMWRIYSYNNRAIRISIKRQNLSLLDDIKTVDIEYTDNLCSTLPKGDEYLKTLFKKRRAFEHEKEVRLVKHYKFSGTDDLKQHMYAWLAIADHPRSVDVLEKYFQGESIESKVRSAVKMLNIGNRAEKTIEVSFSHIPNFINGVLVHPLAPDWYVDIVHEFCKRNNIPFEGKSALYSK